MKKLKTSPAPISSESSEEVKDEEPESSEITETASNPKTSTQYEECRKIICKRLKSILKEEEKLENMYNMKSVVGLLSFVDGEDDMPGLGALICDYFSRVIQH